MVQAFSIYIFQSALRVPTSKATLMCIFLTLFEGTVGYCILVDATLTNANVAPQMINFFFQMLSNVVSITVTLAFTFSPLS